MDEIFDLSIYTDTLKNAIYEKRHFHMKIDNLHETNELYYTCTRLFSIDGKGVHSYN